MLPTSAVLNLPAEAQGFGDLLARLGVRFVVHGAIQIERQWRLSVEMFDAHSQECLFQRRKRDLKWICCPSSKTKSQSRSPAH